MNPSVSIVIPCHDQYQYLHECLQSVCCQSVPDWEVIVVDDASIVGDVADVLEGIDDDRIMLVRHKENCGLAAARNTGISISAGEFLLPLDADDKLAPDYLDKVLPILVDHSEYSCAFPYFYAFGVREGLIRYEIQDVRTLLKRQWLPGPGTLFRKTLWEQVGGYCEAQELRYGNEDWDFWLSAAEIGLSAGHIPEPLYYYRQHKVSMVTHLRYYDYLTREVIYKRHQQLFDRYGMGRSFRVDGYQHSTEASWQRGERLRTAWLAWHGFLIEPERRYLAKLGLRALCPDVLVPFAGRIKKLLGMNRTSLIR